VSTVAPAEPELVEREVVGCRELRPPRFADARGEFVKLFRAGGFRDAGLDMDVRELFWSRSATDVIRGLHFQAPPADVAKLVCCLEGDILDVVLDLRVGSPSYGRHCCVPLSGARANALYVPHGCAHGFLVTRGEALVLYAQSGEHDPVLEGGIAWSSAGIDWPVEPGRVVVSARDAGFPALADFDSPFRFPDAASTRRPPS
jgi:dTDP-4-dehydrorhamnose 3,5-epimerase